MRADSMNQITGRRRAVAIRNIYRRYGNVVQAECLVTNSAVEMDVEIVIMLPGSMAKLIANAITAVFQHMHKMSVTEKGKSTEYTAFIYGFQPPLKFHK